MLLPKKCSYAWVGMIQDLVTELGPIVASFDFGEPIPIENVRMNLGSGTSSIDERLGCLRLNDTRHDLELTDLAYWKNRCSKR